MTTAEYLNSMYHRWAVHNQFELNWDHKIALAMLVDEIDRLDPSQLEPAQRGMLHLVRSKPCPHCGHRS